MKLLTPAVIAALAMVALPPATAFATPPPPPRASTDCNAKVYVIDDLVCGSPELLALDRQVADAFAGAPDASNPEWPRMVEGQQGWYWRSRQCFKQPARRQAGCLTAAYRDRLVELALLASPPAAGGGEPMHCKGPPWAEGRDVLLNRTASASLTLSDPSGQVMAIALPANRAGWRPDMSYRRLGDGWRLDHQNGAAYLVCKPM